MRSRCSDRRGGVTSSSPSARIFGEPVRSTHAELVRRFPPAFPGQTRATTCTIVLAGRAPPNTSRCARPTDSASSMSVR
jgi:hypothetical protein